MNRRDAVVIEAVRTPSGRGKVGGVLSEVHPVELLAQVLAAVVARSGIQPELVEDVLVGCVSQVGEQSTCPGRIAWLAAGLPETVPATTIDRRCGSGQQAAHFGAQGIMAGAYDAVVVAGVESMSRVPMFSARAGDPWGPSVRQRYAPGLVPQGVSAELVASRWDIGREEMDEYAASSHQRAAHAAEAGEFAGQLCAVDTPSGIVDADETIRPGTDTSTLAAMSPAFRDDEAERRFPEISWSVTAGNSSPLTDGASAMLLTSAEFAERHGLRPRATFEGFAVAAGDPILMLDAIVPATRRVLERARLGIADIDRFEVNEAFASVPLMWLREFDPDPHRVNPQGGAIALGHALGASGVRIMTTLLHGMEASGAEVGLQTMCEGSGMANATVLRRVA